MYLHACPTCSDSRHCQLAVYAAFQTQINVEIENAEIMLPVFQKRQKETLNDLFEWKNETVRQATNRNTRGEISHRSLRFTGFHMI